jgi:uncharacterized protein YggE
MTSATIAVKGSASDEFPPDFAVVHFHHMFTTSARAEALAHSNAVITQLREVVTSFDSGFREMKVRSLRVEEWFNVVGPDHLREQAGWSVQASGEVIVEPDIVPGIAAAVTKVGVSISNVSWNLDPGALSAAHRSVRRLAVANALEAANDFAMALGGTLGRLITLADPGLLGAGSFNSGSRGPTRAAGAFFASATSGTSATPWDERVDIDPYSIAISASVEASYEVTID